MLFKELSNELRNVGYVIETMLRASMRLGVGLKQSKAKMSISFFAVIWHKSSHLILLLKSCLQVSNILVVARNGVMLHLLLFFNNFLIVAAVPKVVIASDVAEDSGSQFIQLRFAAVADRQLHQIVLQIVVLKTQELFGGQLAFYELQQIWQKVYVEDSLDSYPH